MSIGYPTVALLFSAIQVTFWVYANTSSAIGGRIATIYEKYRSAGTSDEDIVAYREEISYLAKRATLLRTCQLVAAGAFVVNIVSLFSIFAEHQEAAKLFFGCAVIILLLSILVYAWEVVVSLHALRQLVRRVTEESPP